MKAFERFSIMDEDFVPHTASVVDSLHYVAVRSVKNILCKPLQIITCKPLYSSTRDEDLGKKQRVPHKVCIAEQCSCECDRYLILERS